MSTSSVKECTTILHFNEIGFFKCQVQNLRKIEEKGPVDWTLAWINANFYFFHVEKFCQRVCNNSPLNRNRILQMPSSKFTRN